MRARLPWIVWAIAMVGLGFTIYLGARNDSFSVEAAFLVIAITMVAGYSTIGAVIASRTKGNPIGWLLMSVGVGFLLGGMTDEYLTFAYRRGWDDRALTTFIGWLTNWVFLALVLPIPWILLLFPDGMLPSRRWRPVGIAILVSSALATVASILAPGPIDASVSSAPDNPTGVESLKPVIDVVLAVAGTTLLALGFAAVVGLVLRYRRSRGEERQQMRWFVATCAFGAVLLVAAILSGLGLQGNETRPINEVLFFAFFTVLGIGLPGACAVAILRYRLYDLDLVIKRTAVFAVLVAMLMAIGGVGALLVGLGMVPSLDDSPPLLLLAGVILGLLLMPLYRFSKWVADRIVFGGRSTPYEVLTEFSGRVGETYSSEDVLPRMAQLVGEATRARASRVWLRVGSELHAAATWPPDSPPATSLHTDSDRLPELQGEEAFEVRHQGDLLGALSVEPAPSDPMTPAKRRIVQDLASQAGFVLRNVRLIEELRASRQRLVAAQDEERRKLERNIHDGAQQQLVALTVKLRLLEQIAARDPAKVAEIAAQLQTETTEALEDLRDLARGIYPPLLADQGLPAALQAQARKSSLPIEVDADDLGRFSQDVEAAVYFSCLEALQNVTKYADASSVTISVARSNEHLSFAVVDDGVGFDLSSTTQGTGLQGIADRIDALGGTFTVTTAPGTGTSLRGTVPVV
jgi:signal transduction histidine kinase